MKTTKYITSFMYFIVLFSLIFLTAYFLIGLSAKFFGQDGQYIYHHEKNSYSTIGNKNSEGSLVPIALTLQIPDSITMDKKYYGPVVEYSYPLINNQFLHENKKTKAINIYDITAHKDEDTSLIETEIEEDGSYKIAKPSTFQFIKYVNYGNSQYLSVKTNDTLTDIILALRGQLQFLFYILQMYFIALILKEVAKDIYFSKVLSKYISKLGYLLIFSQLIPIIYFFIDIRLFGNISIRPQILESLKECYFENIQVSFNPTMDLNIYILFSGIVLVLITKLIERGRSLEEENELTI